MKLLSKIENKLTKEKDINENILEWVEEWIKEDYYMIKNYILWFMLVVVDRVKDILE